MPPSRSPLQFLRPFALREIALTLAAAHATSAAAQTTTSARDPLIVERVFVLRTHGEGVANAVIPLSDGGFAVAGAADAGGGAGSDAVFLRFSAAGDTLATRFYGGDRNDYGWDLLEAEDGGFYLVGFTETVAGEDVLVLRLDTAGAVVWRRTEGGPGRERAWSAIRMADGGLVIAGERGAADPEDRDAWLLRLDRDGSTRWARAIAAPGDQRVFAVTERPDGDLVVAGTTAQDARTARDVYVACVSPDGDLRWARTLGGPEDDVGHGVLALPDGDMLVTGYGAGRSGGGANDVYLIRLDPDGNTRWWRRAGGPGDDRAMMSVPRPGGGYLTVGYAADGGDFDMTVLETDAAGERAAWTTLAYPGHDRGVMLRVAGEGRYVLVGARGATDAAPGRLAVAWLVRDPQPDGRAPRRP